MIIFAFNKLLTEINTIRMKTHHERSMKILAIASLLSRSAEAFEGHEVGQELRNRFLEKSETLNQLLKQLVVPFEATYIDRVESRSAYLALLQRLVGMGLMLASRNSDSALLVSMKSFNHRIKEASAARILAIGQAVEQFMQQNSTELKSLGVSTEQQQQLSSLKKAYQQAISQATHAATERRNLNTEIQELIKACNHILRWELDIYLSFHAAHFEDLYAPYQRLRNPKRRQKAQEVEVPVEEVERTPAAEVLDKEPLTYSIPKPDIKPIDHVYMPFLKPSSQAFDLPFSQEALLQVMWGRGGLN